METIAQEIANGIGAALGKMVGDMISSPLGLLLLLLAVFMFVFPVARSLWRKSRWAFGGVVMLLIAAGLFRPQISGQANREASIGPPAIRQNQPRQEPARANAEADMRSEMLKPENTVYQYDNDPNLSALSIGQEATTNVIRVPGNRPPGTGFNDPPIEHSGRDTAPRKGQ